MLKPQVVEPECLTSLHQSRRSQGKGNEEGGREGRPEGRLGGKIAGTRRVEQEFKIILSLQGL